jgi:hypothetical protein
MPLALFAVFLPSSDNATWLTKDTHSCHFRIRQPYFRGDLRSSTRIFEFAGAMPQTLTRFF